MDEATSARTRSDSRRAWVIGVDGSECSRHAALWAMENAPGRTTELQLTTSWSIPVSSMTPMSTLTTGALIESLEDSATRTVLRLADDLSGSPDLAVTTCVAQGGAASLLLDAAQHGDLLVVGSRGRGGFARLVLGSTSTQCATHSPVPVAVIPSSASVARPRSMLVPFDGSANSIAALDWALDFADPGTTVTCVSVWDSTPIAVGADQFFFPEASDLARERFDHLTNDVIAASHTQAATCDGVFLEGRPRQVLAERSNDFDLVVMGARGHGAIGAAVLGSVSTWLLHHVSKAMVVVPDRPHQAGSDVDVDEVVAEPED